MARRPQVHVTCGIGCCGTGGRLSWRWLPLKSVRIVARLCGQGGKCTQVGGRRRNEYAQFSVVDCCHHPGTLACQSPLRTDIGSVSACLARDRHHLAHHLAGATRLIQAKVGALESERNQRKWFEVRREACQSKMARVQLEVDHVMGVVRAKAERLRPERLRVEEPRPGARRADASRT